MIARELLRRVKAALSEEFQDRFRGIVLFGSEARGDAADDSDVDLLVLLRGPVKVGDDLDRIIKATYPIQLEVDRVLSAIPMDERAYEEGSRRFLRQVRREGILV